MTQTPTPTAPRAITLHLRNYEDETIGEFAARLIPNAQHDAGAYAVTHGLGSLAGGTHTEVAFVDGTAANLPDSTARSIVRAVAHELYDRVWAFDYAPASVPASVLRHGSILRERVEVSDVVIYA